MRPYRLLTFAVLGIQEARHVCVRAYACACVCVSVCVSVCACEFVCQSMWQKHMFLWNVVISKALRCTSPNRFWAVDYSNHFMHVTWCMMTYIHACNKLSFTRSRRVRK